MAKVYKILWDNGHASGTLSAEFTSRRAAENAGRDWKREMVAIETSPKDRTEARRVYSWEVTEAEPEPDPETFDNENTYEHFNRYIAGDR